MNTPPKTRPASIQPGRCLLLGLVLLTAHALLPSEAAAQTTVPLLVNYQGTVTDSTGLPLGATGTVAAPVAAPTNRKVIFRLWDASAGGTRLWTEEQTVTISLGQFSVLLGQGINATGTAAGESRPALDTVFTGTGSDRYLGITVDNGDNSITAADAEITPRQRITSVAYALRARAADSVASTTDLMLGGSANYGLGWYGTGRTFNSTAINGPVLYGQGGGVLGAVNGATQTPVLRWNELGQVGIGTTNLPSGSRLTLQGDDTNAPPLQINIRGNTDVNKRLLIGYNTTGNYGSVQAYSGASTTTNLLLNQAGGNVGIGTTTPLNTLHVNGVISSRTSTSTHGYVALQPGDASNDGYIEWLKPGGGRSAFLGYSGANHLQLNMAGSHHFLITGNGNVGIGAASPKQKLHVNGDYYGNGHVWLHSNSGDGQSGTAYLQARDDSTTSNINLQLRTKAGNNVVETMMLTSGGNVGIGTTTPGERLTVIGSGSTSASTALNVFNSSLGNLFSVRNDGNVGIGTSAPQSNLQVAGIISARSTTLSGGYVAMHTGGASNDGYIEWVKPGNIRTAYMGYGSGSSVDLVLSGSNNFNITGGGNVGIGTNAPAAKLHIKAGVDNNIAAGLRLEHAVGSDYWSIFPENNNNNLIFMYNNQYPGGVYTLLSSNSSGFITVSDIRIKKDIEIISGSLERLMKLRPKTYRFKTAAAETPLNYGFIAQEVEQVYPHLVSENHGQKTLATNSLIAINTQAIQELKTEKDAELKALKSEIFELKAQLAKIQAKDKARDAKLAAIEKLLLATDKPAVQPVSLKKSAGGAE